MARSTPESLADRWSAWTARFRDRLFEPVDGASLAVFRILFGLLMVWEVGRFWDRSDGRSWIRDYYILPQFHFKYYGFEWVRAWPGDGMYIHFAVLGLAGLLLALGLLYRPAALLIFLTFSYVFLLDQARYLNHFYLVCLVAFVMIFVNGHGAWSLDRLLFFRRRAESVPYWNVFLLRAQMCIVYVYAGIAKINPDWLRARPVADWIRNRDDTPFIGHLFREEWVAYFVAYFGLIYDLSIGFLLFYRRTRPVAIALALFFHGGNKFLFNIGIFPYLAMALTLMFLEPDWPRQVLHRIARMVPWATGAGRSDGRGQVRPDEALGPCPVPEGRRATVEPHGARRPRQATVLWCLGLYLAWQVLFPLRHWLYPGDVNWTEEGHRFSWRMKLRDKEGVIAFAVFDPASGREWHPDPRLYLAPWQLEEMVGRPDMIVQFAHYLAARYRQRQNLAERPEVYVSALVSLNGSRLQELIDPDVDLADRARPLGQVDWILPRHPTRYPLPEVIRSLRRGATDPTDDPPPGAR